MATSGSDSVRVVNPWLPYLRPRPEAELRLFCFPYAGGGASIFYNWPSALPPSIEVCAVQLPGREHLLRDAPYTQLPELILAIRRVLARYMDKPFVFYGHSMGGLLAFELARSLRKEGGPQPRHLLASGCRAPHLIKDDRITYNLPDPELLEELRSLKGTPEEVLENPELIALLLPILRADFEVFETYEHATAPPLNCPISAFGGIEDAKVEYQHLEAWREHTSAPCRVRMLPGGHFFLREAQSELLQIIAHKLLAEVGSLRKPHVADPYA